ncbi:MAG: PAS domain S-box protein [Dehalococcoidia bacterium]|nr:PAS domain S-box protein [Dehalococcoidia bacterium]
MGKKVNRPSAARDLRKRAEEKARVDKAPTREVSSTEAAQKVAQELRVHRIELEMQNEELRRAQVELEAARSRYFDLYDMAPVGYVTLSEKKLILEANLTISTMLGVSKSALVKKPLGGFILPEDQDLYYLQCKQVLDTGVPQVREMRMARKDGSAFWVRVEAIKAKDVDSSPLLRAIVSDITKHKQSEDALRESEEKYRSLVEGSIEGIGYSKGNSIVYANGALLDLFGYDSLKEFASKPLLDHVSPESKELILDRIKKRDRGESLPSRYEYRIVRKDGSLRDVEIVTSMFTAGGESYTQSTFRDVTDRKRNEEDQNRAQKLESVGTLAGGIAHDFNNMLTGILGNISFVRSELPHGRKLDERLEEAEKACLQAKGLTQQLLTFAKGGAPIKKIVSIAELIRDNATLALRGSGTRCEYSVPDDLCPVEVDEGQIGQVIANLVINAAEVTPAGGILYLEAKNSAVRKEDALPLSDGAYAQIIVRDRGVGIPKEHLSRIFEPYFTTKKSGSGLGLAASHSIIKNHGGHITVESEVGVGTTFRVYLPASAKPAPVKAREEQYAPTVGEGRILVMDDDDAIRSLLSDILESAGYGVELAVDGVEAIEKFARARAAGNPFDTVIMDLTIPGGMGGKEAIKELLRIDPQVKAIVSSGYSNDPAMANFRQYGFKGVVAKPYKIGDMVNAVRRVLAERA